MKCPHCQMEDVLVTTASELRLLSFVFTTINCPHCSAIFAVPDPDADQPKPRRKSRIRPARVRNAA